MHKSIDKQLNELLFDPDCQFRVYEVTRRKVGKHWMEMNATPLGLGLEILMHIYRTNTRRHHNLSVEIS